MSLFDTILKITPFFNSISLLENFIVVKAKFPATWEIKSPNNAEIEVVKGDNFTNEREYLFATEFNEENTNLLIESIFHLIDINGEREEKNNLFKEKVRELKDLFDEEKLINLKNLNFNLREKIVPETIPPIND